MRLVNEASVRIDALLFGAILRDRRTRRFGEEAGDGGLPLLVEQRDFDSPPSTRRVEPGEKPANRAAWLPSGGTPAVGCLAQC